MQKTALLRRFLLIALSALLIAALPSAPNANPNCSDEDKKYAEFWNNYYNPEDAYQFGVLIQQHVANRDLVGLFGLVESELSNGPRKRFIENRNFDEVFSEGWRNTVVASESPCQPVGWRGFMLANGLIWFNVGPGSPGAWQIFSINDATQEDYTPAVSDPAWRVEGKIVPPKCFVKIWMSGENFKAYEETFGITDTADFRTNTGQYFGREIDRIDPINAPWSNEKVSLAAPLDSCDSTELTSPGSSQKPPTVEANDVSSESCDKDGICVQYKYRLLAPISLTECRKLAPRLPGRCESAYLIQIGDYSGGSMGWNFGFNVYGLFHLDNGRNAIVPLVNFYKENNARNFVEDLGNRR